MPRKKKQQRKAEPKPQPKLARPKARATRLVALHPHLAKYANLLNNPWGGALAQSCGDATGTTNADFTVPTWSVVVRRTFRTTVSAPAGATTCVFIPLSSELGVGKFRQVDWVSGTPTGSVGGAYTGVQLPVGGGCWRGIAGGVRITSMNTADKVGGMLHVWPGVLTEFEAIDIGAPDRDSLNLIAELDLAPVCFKNDGRTHTLRLAPSRAFRAFNSTASDPVTTAGGNALWLSTSHTWGVVLVIRSPADAAQTFDIDCVSVLEYYHDDHHSYARPRPRVVGATAAEDAYTRMLHTPGGNHAHHTGFFGKLEAGVDKLTGFMHKAAGLIGGYQAVRGALSGPVARSAGPVITEVAESMALMAV